MSERERHLAWLRDLNAMAKAANGGPVPVQPMPPPNVPSSHAAFPQQHHHHSMQHPMMYPPQMMAHAMGVPQNQSSKPAAESAEKRAKRLERNRESARKSRRRKKERLNTLEAQVNSLHAQIDAERKTQVNQMVTTFRKRREEANDEHVLALFRAKGSNSEVTRAVLDYQYMALKQLILPRYHKMLLWLTLSEESYFYAGKEEYAKRETKKMTSGKVSSKQIGDEMTNGVKDAKGKKRVTFKDSGAQKPNLSPNAYDGATVWPLLCYEISFSVDQEDRFVATQKRIREKEGLASSRSQMMAAVQTADSLREAVESVSRVVAQREDRAYSVLGSAKIATYHKWVNANRERCQGMLERRGTDNSSSIPIDTSLHDICRRLNEVLQISARPTTHDFPQNG